MITEICFATNLRVIIFANCSFSMDLSAYWEIKKTIHIKTIAEKFRLLAGFDNEEKLLYVFRYF